MEPKVKPKMDAPKVSGRQMGVVHDARDMLTKHYKEQAAQRQPDAGKESPTEYATRKMDEKLHDAGRVAVDTGRRAVRNYRDMGKSQKVRAQRSAAEQQKGKLKRQRANQQRERSPHRAKTKDAAARTKQGGVLLGKGASRADRVKTASAMKRKAKAAAPAKNAMRQQAAKLAKATKEAAKKTAQLLAKIAKAIVRGIIAIAGACGPLLVLIIAIAAVAAIIASPFGIFFSGEDDSPDTTAIQEVVAELSGEFSQNLQTIIHGNSHDEMRLNFTNRGYKRGDNWIDMLAVFAVKTAGADDGTDVVTIDPDRIDRLRQVYGDMVLVEFEKKNELKPDPNTGQDVDHYVLYINITCKGAWEMADEYSFTSQQREILGEMLNGEYDDYFAELIGSVGLFGMVGDGGAVVGSGNFLWPSASSTYVTSPFGGRTHPITGVYDDHYGIDISAGENTGVLAADGGTVVTAGEHWSYGNYIEIDHGNGYMTLYAHNNSLLVSAGDTVEQGQQIALVGSTGVSGGFHIHFEVKLNGTRLDPLQFFTNYTTAW